MSDSIDDDSLTATGDSDIRKASEDPGVLKVYQTGQLTVVGFAGQDVPDEVCVAGYRDQMNKLIEEHGVKVMAVDLSGVKLVPSGRLKVQVELPARGIVGQVAILSPLSRISKVVSPSGSLRQKKRCVVGR